MQVITMANIQVLQGKRGKTYRVQFMRDGSRVTKTFKTRKSAEEFNSTLSLHSDVFNSLTNHALTSHTLADAISEYLQQHNGKDKNVAGRLDWWCKQLGQVSLGKINRADIKKALKRLSEDGTANSTVTRFKCAIS